MKNKQITIGIFSIIITAIKALLFVPVKITGGFAGVNYSSYKPLSIVINKETCKDCFNYTINYLQYFIENITVLLVCIVVGLVISKVMKLKRQNNDKCKKTSKNY